MTNTRTRIDTNRLANEELTTVDEWADPMAMADAFNVAMKNVYKGDDAETVDYENVEVGTQLTLPIKTNRIKG